MPRSSQANTRTIKAFPHFSGSVLDAFGPLYHLAMRQRWIARLTRLELQRYDDVHESLTIT